MDCQNALLHLVVELTMTELLCSHDGICQPWTAWQLGVLQAHL